MIERVLLSLSWPVSGFRTQLVGSRSDPDRVLMMVPAGLQWSPNPGGVVTRFLEGTPQPLPEQFNLIGAKLLRESTKGLGLILMDELGRFEREALLFREAVLECLDGEKPVLGVMASNAAQWVQRIRTRPDVCVFTVTPLSRDDLPERIAAHFLHIAMR